MNEGISKQIQCPIFMVLTRSNEYNFQGRREGERQEGREEGKREEREQKEDRKNAKRGNESTI